VGVFVRLGVRVSVAVKLGVNVGVRLGVSVCDGVNVCDGVSVCDGVKLGVGVEIPTKAADTAARALTIPDPHTLVVQGTLPVSAGNAVTFPCMRLKI
jgi:hypothetical protein